MDFIQEKFEQIVKSLAPYLNIFHNHCRSSRKWEFSSFNLIIDLLVSPLLHVYVVSFYLVTIQTYLFFSPTLFDLKSFYVSIHIQIFECFLLRYVPIPYFDSNFLFFHQLIHKIFVLIWMLNIIESRRIYLIIAIFKQFLIINF